MNEQPKKVTYLVNSKHSLNLQFGGNMYKIPAGATTIPELSSKLDIPEDLALLVARHAASTYAAVRRATKPKQKSAPPETWVWLESRLEDEAPPVEAPPEPQSVRVEAFQEAEEEDAEDLAPEIEMPTFLPSRTDIFKNSLRTREH